MTPFDILKSIQSNGNDLSSDPEFGGSYAAFLINRGLSLHVDTILYANEMNKAHFLPKEMQYAYLFHAIRKKKRAFHKWPKKLANDDNLELVKQYFGFNTEKAKAALPLLNDEQLKIINDAFILGGIIRNNDDK